MERLTGDWIGGSDYKTGKRLPIPLCRLMIGGYQVRLFIQPDGSLHMLAPIDMKDSSSITWFEDTQPGGLDVRPPFQGIY